MKSALPKKKVDSNWTKMMVDHKTLPEGRERSLEYFREPDDIKISTGFRQL